MRLPEGQVSREYVRHDASGGGTQLARQPESRRERVQRDLYVLGRAEELVRQAVVADEVQLDRMRSCRGNPPGRAGIDDAADQVQVGFQLIAADRDDLESAVRAA